MWGLLLLLFCRFDAAAARCLDADAVLESLEGRLQGAQVALVEAARRQGHQQVQALHDSIEWELQEQDTQLQLKLMQVG